MDISRLLRTVFKKDLTRRELVIVALTVIALVSALVYQFPYRMLERSVKVLNLQITAAEQDIRSLSLHLDDIKARDAEIRAGLAKGGAGWQLSDSRGVILFLDDVSSEASRQGVNLIAVHPAQEVDREKYREVAMNLDLKGRYRELAEYFRKLENLARIVNIRKIRVEACPDASSTCATQLEAVTYMEK